MPLVVRQALGDVGDLGYLYNAVSDTIIEESIFKGKEAPEELFKESAADEPTTKWTDTISNTLKEKFDLLDVSTGLRASLLSGSLPYNKLLSKYLDKYPTTRRKQEVSILYSVRTVLEELTLGDDKGLLLESINTEELDLDEATHVICGIHWGSTTIITARDPSDKPVLQPQLRDGLMSLCQTAAGGEAQHAEYLKTLSYEVQSHVKNARKAISYKLVSEFIRNIHGEMHKVGGGKGWAVAYNLMPLADLTKMIDCESEYKVVRAADDILPMFSDLFNEVVIARQDLNDYLDDVKKHMPQCVPVSEVEAVDPRVNAFKNFESETKAKFKTALEGYRIGDSDLEELQKVLEDVKQKFDEVSSMKFAEKITFYDSLIKENITYVASTPAGLNPVLMENEGQEGYVLHFNAKTMTTPMWQANVDKIREKIPEAGQTHVVVLVDHDIGDCYDSGRGACTHLDQPRIEVWRGGSRAMTDLIADIQSIQGKSLLRCVDNLKISTDKEWNVPKEQRLVKVACPTSGCSSDGSIYQWICPDCKEIICYDENNVYLYCNCGRYKVSDTVFKCEGPAHGPDFAPPASLTELMELLRNLDPVEQYNILILGETGIGKSTFINAFVNYMVYATLDSAIRDPGPLKWAVPCQFEYDERNERNIIAESVVIEVGSQTEYDTFSTGGESATQKCVVYVLNMRGRIVRLIDTPGIGDTRGPAQDAKNVQDILKTLESVDKLSAIMYLMNPGSPRLTTVFKFCLTELLIHLHKNATDNIVFGFTRSGPTKFSLGGTRGPLQELLKSHKISLEKLEEANMFFFEAEGFLYLAAWKIRQKRMGDIAGYAASWGRSAEEARRLIEFTMGLPTHEVRETLSLNRTRNTVVGLTKPMIAIAEALRTTKEDINDQKNNIKKCQLEGKDIPDLVNHHLVAKKKTYKYPRTVCADKACKKFIDGIVQYPEICHEDCDIIDAADEIVGVEQLTRCSAMDSFTGDCDKCGHSWRTHLHTKYELYWAWESTPNEEAAERLRQNESADNMAYCLLKIANEKLEDVEKEDKIVQESLALFGVYLDHYAIVAINDATVAYLEMLISDGKLSRTKEARLRVQRLQDQKAAYEKKVDAIKDAIARKSLAVPNENTVTDAIDKLGDLKYAGPDMLKVIGRPPTLELAKNRTVRVPLKPSGTTPYEWMEQRAQRILEMNESVEA